MRAAAEVLIVSAVAPLATRAAEAWLTAVVNAPDVLGAARGACADGMYLYLYALSDRLSDHSDSDHCGSECEAVANATTSDGCGAAFAHLVLGYIAT